MQMILLAILYMAVGGSIAGFAIRAKYRNQARTDEMFFRLQGMELNFALDRVDELEDELLEAQRKLMPKTQADG